uniref:Uncharacterized protein n=1 Tax=Lactuca sativa TaxID=4236 RepID=A0A9R1USX1_LACSA|nr:hypothetical protein LSAT_V11C800447220 [Lactuca sativa]
MTSGVLSMTPTTSHTNNAPPTVSTKDAIEARKVHLFPVHIVKNDIAHLLNIKVPLILGEPGRLIRDLYCTASQVIQNQGKLSCLMINDINASLGRFDELQI